MAYIVQVRLLVDAPDTSQAHDAINEMLRPLTAEPGCLVDYSQGCAVRVTVELEDAIVNETYSEGDAFHNF